MSQYLLSVHHIGDYPDMNTPEAQAQFAATGVFNDKMMADGQWVFAGGLERIENSTTVDGTGSDVIVTDGPFAETKEYLGGFWVIDVPDLDVALKLAAEGSKACGAKVEVRPFQG
jgi:hypothetical protein